MKIEEVEVKKINSDKVVAQAKVNFGWFKLAGFKIIYSEKDRKHFVTAPSYKSSFGWKPLFFTTKTEDWDSLCGKILNKFDELLIKESIDESLDDAKDIFQ